MENKPMTLLYDTLTATEAVAIQNDLRSRIQLKPLEKQPTLIAGSDISFNKYSPTVYAGIVVLKFPELQVIETVSVIDEIHFPYVPGLLAFREVPALVKCWEKLQHKPDVLVLDGHGISHPRRMGIATHFGVLMQTPTMGCAKSLLTGKYGEPANEPGAATDLIHQNEIVAKVLRTKRNTKPVFVSPGNLITQTECLQIIMQCVKGYRIPEPTRLAHNFVNEVRVKNGEQEAKSEK
jgi:deoxyribonuclease V